MTGRTKAKLENTITELLAQQPEARGRIHFSVMDGSNPEALEAGAKEIRAKFGEIAVLINNAGSAGPKQELSQIPVTREELERLRASGSSDTETLHDAIGSLLGGPWYTTQAFHPYSRMALR